jgi:hypothetical protein
MNPFITSVDKHNEIKQYVLDMIADINFADSDRVVPLSLDHNKIQEWYGDAIEEFRQFQIDQGKEHTIFDPQIIWINVYPTGASMNSHTHPDYHFYSIHYLQKSLDHPHTQLSDDGVTWTDPDAVEGDIIFFSGTTYHRVLENTSNMLRISIGMNASSVENTPVNLEELRKVRNQKLAETDWWVMSDVNASEEKLNYRQALRDITHKYTSLQNVVWPTWINL